MKEWRRLLPLLILAISLAACGSKEETEEPFTGGTFYCEAYVSLGKPTEYYIFNEDGSGVIHRVSTENEFLWNIEDGKIFTTLPLPLSSCWEYVEGYLINPTSNYEGRIPKGITFEATAEKIIDQDTTIRLHFQKDGIVEMANTKAGDGDTAALPYTREGNLISVNGGRDYLVVDEKLYANPLKPYTIEVEQ